MSEPALRDKRMDLASHSRQIVDLILARQDPVSGLLPASTAVTVHGDYRHAWVRDNVYSILAPWAVALAWRRFDPPRSGVFEQAVEQLMRGLLAAMMKQSHKVERFKHTQDPLDALHAKYDTASGEPVVGDADWGHLQIDATALFVLMLAQMSATGLSLVRNDEELAFVQNLVHYLARAWCTPDFGIWERGHKRNEGLAELNASSLGMAKAALEAIDGFEPIPGRPVFVIGDDIARARDALQALLPRESASKETDAALLAVVGYPAYAVDDAGLAQRTWSKVLEKLQGRYGCRRFLRDGHQTAIEDHDRLHYEPGELQRFENIECEWPLFFAYLFVESAMRGSVNESANWREKLDQLMEFREGHGLLPELYRVPAERILAEREHPHSQERVPNENLPLVWAQSLYLLGALLHEGHVDPADLDPLGRRFSAGNASQTIRINVALMADGELTRARLAEWGVDAQTPAEIMPLRLRDAEELEIMLTGLGQCPSLGLSGRPRQRLGSIASSHVYDCAGERALIVPPLFGAKGSCLALDNRLLMGAVAAELARLRRHWRRQAEPLFVLQITAQMLNAPGADVLFDSLQALARNPGLRLGPVQELLPFAAARLVGGPIDWPVASRSAAVPMAPAPQLNWEEAASRALSPNRMARIAAEGDVNALLGQLERSRNPFEQIEIAMALWRRTGPELQTSFGLTLGTLVQAVRARAGLERRWGVLRRATGLLQVIDDGLEDAIAGMVGCGKRISLGRLYEPAAVVSRPLADDELRQLMVTHGGDEPRSWALIQEATLLLGMLIRSDAGLFAGALTLRPWQSLSLLAGWLAREHGISQAEAFDHLLDLSPKAILDRLREVVTREQEMTISLRRLQSLQCLGGDSQLAEICFRPDQDPTLDLELAGWLAWREITGVIVRLPEAFYERTWNLLQHCKGLVIGDQLVASNLLVSTVAGADTTAGERNFALQVEELLSRIQMPEYRQLTIEALMTLSELVDCIPDLRFNSPLVLDVLISRAATLDIEAGATEGPTDHEQIAQAWMAFYESPPHRVANLLVASLRACLDLRAD